MGVDGSARRAWCCGGSAVRKGCCVAWGGAAMGWAPWSSAKRRGWCARIGEVMAWGRWLRHGEEGGGAVVKGRQPGRLPTMEKQVRVSSGVHGGEAHRSREGISPEESNNMGCAWPVTTGGRWARQWWHSDIGGARRACPWWWIVKVEVAERWPAMVFDVTRRLRALTGEGC